MPVTKPTPADLRRWLHALRSALRWPFRSKRRAAGAGAVCGLVGYLLLAQALSVSCPDGTACVTLAELRDGAELPEAFHLYDRSGVILAEVNGPLREALPREQIPDLLVDAYIAVEDRRFWEHGGVDGRGVLRAALTNLREGGRTEGASTIPMQLVRTLWAESLRDAHPWRRKIIEARTAPDLIRELGHERVLELYLNAIYLGNGVYGVERASRYYFGTGVESLTLGQIALLVGMTRAPESYEPFRYPERALDMRNVVLRRLMQAGIVSKEEAQEAASRDLDLARRRPEGPPSNQRTHLTAAITRELRRVAPDLASRPGLRIHTSIDRRMQEDGESALEAQIHAIETGRYGPFSTTDSTVVLEGAAVAMDPSTGAVLAWVGGRDFTRSEFDRVDLAERQVGSLIKPFLVGAALEDGFGVVDLVSADTVPIATETGPWMPADHVDDTTLPLREALIRSSNRAAAHLGVTLGAQAVVDVARRAGFGDIAALPSASLGAFEASLLEMTAAYAAFGNGGERVTPHLITRVESTDGSLLWSEPAAEDLDPVLGPREAFVVLDALEAVVDRGTGSAVRSAGYSGPAAGKTGTTNDGRDAWFIGLTPDVVAGVWIGFDQPREIVPGRGGSALAAPAWGHWMQDARATRVARRESMGEWIPPDGVEQVRYDPTTGEVLDRGCTRPLRADFPEAWVVAGSYVPRICRGGLGGWLDRVWRGFVPQSREPLRPLIRNPR
jgi:penicillin-binding protein 1A